MPAYPAATKLDDGQAFCMKAPLFAVECMPLLDGRWSFPLGYGVQAFQEVFTEAIYDGSAITGTCLERFAFSKNDIALSELKVDSARAC